MIKDGRVNHVFDGIIAPSEKDKTKSSCSNKFINIVKIPKFLFSSKNIDEKLPTNYEKETGDIMFHEITNEMAKTNFNNLYDAFEYMKSVKRWFVSHYSKYNYKDVKQKKCRISFYICMISNFFFNLLLVLLVFFSY